jgi:acylphosphatase
MKRVHVLVSGRVTGVGFRYFVQRWALRLALTGWVRNLPDESVETVAEGDEQALQDFVRCLKEGPPFSRVEGFSVEWENSSGDFQDFRIVSFR